MERLLFFFFMLSKKGVKTMPIRFSQKGNFKRTEKFLMNAKERKFFKALDKYGREGVEALKQATPRDTGLTAESWSYEIHWSKKEFSITWTNSNMTEYNIPVAILLQYGHATKNGGYVTGIDYINPAIKPIFDKMANEAWKEMTK